jgi:hypothetical protein
MTNGALHSITTALPNADTLASDITDYGVLIESIAANA